jgi:glutaconyl-CoA/methylmalonyl-CoA decarboxylase subunit delta
MNMLLVTGSISAIGTENYIIALVGQIIVFGALTLLVALFLALPKLVQMETRRTMRRKGQPVPEGKPSAPISGEENAAIAMSVYLYLNEIHDDESNIVTIKKVSRSYSPWSSKIYGLNGTGKRQW